MEGREVVLVDDVVFRAARCAQPGGFAHLGPSGLRQIAGHGGSRHRELPIQPDFIGRVVPTSRHEFIHLMLQEVDGEEVLLLRPLQDIN